MDYIACQVPLSMEFSRQKYWSGLPCPPRGSPLSMIKPTSLRSAALVGKFFTISTTEEAHNPLYLHLIVTKELIPDLLSPTIYSFNKYLSMCLEI